MLKELSSGKAKQRGDGQLCDGLEDEASCASSTREEEGRERGRGREKGDLTERTVFARGHRRVARAVNDGMRRNDIVAVVPLVE